MEAEKDLDHLHNIDKEQGHASYAKDAVVAKNLDLIHDAAEQPATEAEKRKVLLKIDSIILPILFAVVSGCRLLSGAGQLTQAS